MSGLIGWHKSCDNHKGDFMRTDEVLGNGLSVGLTCGIRVKLSISTPCLNRM